MKFTLNLKWLCLALIVLLLFGNSYSQELFLDEDNYFNYSISCDSLVIIEQDTASCDIDKCKIQIWHGMCNYRIVYDHNWNYMDSYFANPRRLTKVPIYGYRICSKCLLKQKFELWHVYHRFDSINKSQEYQNLLDKKYKENKQ